MSDIRNDDAVQHGIDDNTSGDAAKGAALGGLGGVAVGAAAGSVIGPIGTVIGAVVGGLLGAGASGAAVAAVDAVDNDNTVSGVGDGATLKSGERVGTSGNYGTTPDVHMGTTGMSGATASGDYERGSYAGGTDVDAGGHNVVTGDEAHTGAGKAGLGTGALIGGTIGAAVGGPVGAVVGGTLGSLAGGVAGDAGEATAETSMSTSNMGNTPGIMTGTTPDVHAGTTSTTNTSYAQLTGGDYATRPYGTHEGRSVSRTDYNAMPENDRMRVQLMEEELHVDKQVRQIGEVEIGKRVVTEQVNVPVSLEHEEVIIHQTKVSGGDAHGAVIGDSQTIKVPLTEEVAQITKTTSVTGEVEIEKRVASEQKTISDTVRREELEVNKGTTGRVTVQDDTQKM